MKIIAISGIIARWEMSSESNVTPETLRQSLNDANGESVRIDINSPGGNVSEGLEMYNMIKNYKGHTTTNIVSMAASMASIIALAGNEKTAEKTASYMIHNAAGVTWGDYREVAKYAERLKAISGHLSNIYTDKTGIKNSEIRDQMNEETWSYGEELENYGFKIVDSENSDDLETAKFQAHTRYDNYIAEMKARPEEHAKDIEKVSASIGIKKIKETIETSTNPGANSGKNKKEEKSVAELKSLDDLKAQNSDLYAEAVQVGVNQHKDIVNAHLTMGKAGNCLDLAVKNIEAGNEITATVNAEYMAAGMKAKDVEDRSDDDVEETGNGEDETEETEAKNKEYEKALGKGMRGKRK